MVAQRSRRLRLLESLRRTVSELLHDRVQRLALSRGRVVPQNTSSIYASAVRDEPELLDQLLLIHSRVGEEMGSQQGPEKPSGLDDRQRKAMLSAVRAAVNRSRSGHHPDAH
jgi:hypothetical protein